MGFRPPSNEFNTSATPSQDMLRRLMAIALGGGEALHSLFSAMAENSGRTERGRAAREKEIERTATFMRTVMATQERVAEFQKKLDAMQRESYEALIKSEERVREARKELERIRERAYEVPLPDGSKLKVYRDGDQVRDDDDNLVDESIIRAEEIPDSCPTRAERRKGQEVVEKREEEHADRLDNHARIEAAQEALRKDGLTPEEFEEIKEDLEPVTRRFEDARPSADEEFTRPHSISSMPGPR
jgi:hypothetical protein